MYFAIHQTPPVKFWPKGQRLKFDVNIKDKTCNLLFIICIVCLELNMEVEAHETGLLKIQS
ncbi:hypothetical protein HanPSC8_Chr08g0316231 [Helianthus annuus]|nr:hypothetical protein HanPSC8_Chr08g0316231 [Helianthus annuus]